MFYIVHVWKPLPLAALCLQASRARLFKEYKEVQREKSADPDIQLVCDDSNIFKWTALIKVGAVLMDKNGALCCCLTLSNPSFSFLAFFPG